jgi:hypothetical protein
MHTNEDIFLFWLCMDSNKYFFGTLFCILELSIGSLIVVINVLNYSLWVESVKLSFVGFHFGVFPGVFTQNFCVNFCDCFFISFVHACVVNKLSVFRS